MVLVLYRIYLPIIAVYMNTECRLCPPVPLFYANRFVDLLHRLSVHEIMPVLWPFQRKRVCAVLCSGNNSVFYKFHTIDFLEFS